MKDFEKYKKQRENPSLSHEAPQREYRYQSRRLNMCFKEDALKEVGLSNHPKSDKIYQMAWEKGHSEGLQAVYYALQELAKIIL
jgi:hypothetical protein